MNIDEVTLNFNPTSLLALDLVLAFIMFGIALAVKVEDFSAVLTMPKAVAVAIAAQFLLLPAVTFCLTILIGAGSSIALALGYATAKAFRLDDTSTRAVTFGVGIRNAGLGLSLVFAFFHGLGGMVIVAGWWGIWDIVAGLALATLWTRRGMRQELVVT